MSNIKKYKTLFDEVEFDKLFDQKITDDPREYSLPKITGKISLNQNIIMLKQGNNKIYFDEGILNFLAIESRYHGREVKAIKLPKEICCEKMNSHLKEGKCNQHGNFCPDLAIIYDAEEGNKYTLVAENSISRINHCPWCGKRIDK